MDDDDDGETTMWLTPADARAAESTSDRSDSHPALGDLARDEDDDDNEDDDEDDEDDDVFVVAEPEKDGVCFRRTAPVDATLESASTTDDPREEETFISSVEEVPGSLRTISAGAEAPASVSVVDRLTLFAVFPETGDVVSRSSLDALINPVALPGSVGFLASSTAPLFLAISMNLSYSSLQKDAFSSPFFFFFVISDL